MQRALISSALQDRREGMRAARARHAARASGALVDATAREAGVMTRRLDKKKSKLGLDHGLFGGKVIVWVASFEECFVVLRPIIPTNNDGGVGPGLTGGRSVPGLRFRVFLRLYKHSVKRSKGERGGKGEREREEGRGEGREARAEARGRQRASVEAPTTR